MIKIDSIMRAQSRGDSGFARVLTIVVLMLIAATGAWAKLAKVTFAGNNNSKTVYVDLPYEFWTASRENSGSYDLDNYIKEFWGITSKSYAQIEPEVSGGSNMTVNADWAHNAYSLTISDVFSGSATLSVIYFYYVNGDPDVKSCALTITAEEVDNSGWATDIAAGQYYIVDAESKLMMAAGHDWGTRGIVSDEGLDLALTPNTSSNTVTIDSRVMNGENNHFLGTNLYMDASAFVWAFIANGDGYNLYDYTSQKYVSVDSKNNLTLSDTPRKWLVVSKADMMAQLKTKMATATKNNPVDATLLITAPNFSRNDARNGEAWKVSEDCTNYNPSGGEDGDGNIGNNCAESYHSKFTISQTITDAPAGIYRMTAQGFYRQDENPNPLPAAPTFFANEATGNVPAINGDEDNMTKAAKAFNDGKYIIEPIEFVVKDDGKMCIGISATTADQWVVWDNFRLSYLGPVEPVVPGTVKLAKDTEDADNWTAKTGDATEFGPLPLADVAEGTKVTLKYTGDREVKSIKAKVTGAAPKAAAEVTYEDVGKVIGADGNIYDTKDAAEAVATGNAIAMIAYVGTASECTTGLAIALEDVSSSTYTWGDAAGAVTTWASGKTAPTTGSWRLPSIKDWQYILIGCGASGSYSENPDELSYNGLASKLSTAKGNALQQELYWSSTEDALGIGAWFVYFYNVASFNHGSGDECCVRPVLAF